MVALVAGCLAFPFAGEASASHFFYFAGPAMHWKSSGTIREVQTNRTFSNDARGDQWNSWFFGTLSDWSLMRLSPRGGVDSNTDRYNCPIGYTGIRVCNYFDYAGLGNNGNAYAGLAEFLVVYSTGHISRGRVRLDDRYSGIAWSGYCYAPPTNALVPCLDYAHAVLCQELGHEYGLDHIGGGTCMGNGYFADSAGVYHPNATDYDHLNGTLYAHWDSGSSVAATSASSSSPGPAPGDRSGEGTDVPLPAKGDCGTRKVKENVFVRRACGEPEETAGQDAVVLTVAVPPARRAICTGGPDAKQCRPASQ